VYFEMSYIASFRNRDLSTNFCWPLNST